MNLKYTQRKNVRHRGQQHTCCIDAFWSPHFYYKKDLVELAALQDAKQRQIIEFEV